MDYYTNDEDEIFGHSYDDWRLEGWQDNIPNYIDDILEEIEVNYADTFRALVEADMGVSHYSDVTEVAHDKFLDDYSSACSSLLNMDYYSAMSMADDVAYNIEADTIDKIRYGK